MMRKFSKILALVLALAMVLCPVLTAAAETSDVAVNGNVAFTLSDDATVATLAVDTTDADVAFNAINFQVKFNKGVAYEGSVTVDDTNYTVSTNFDDEADVLTVLALDNTEGLSGETYELTFSIAVSVTNANDYDLYLTKIHAVGAGASDDDENVVVFPYADNDQSGVIDVETARAANTADEAVADYFVSNICAHTNTEVTTVDATCTEDGSTTTTCTDCGTVISTDPISAKDHDYDKEAMLVEDTAETVGYIAYDALCTRCDAKNPKYYDADENVLAFESWSQYVDVDVFEVDEIVGETHETATDWSYDETNHWKACVVEGCEEHKYEEATHTWDEGTVTTAATVTTAGVKTYTCTAKCGATKTEEIPATNLYVNYTKVAYDLVSNKLTLTYGAPGDEFKAALSAGGKASAGRTVHLVVQIGEGDSKAEFTFAGSVSSGGGSMAASGFALSHMSQKVTLFIRVANANTGYLWESNAYEIVIADYLTEQYTSGADTSAKLAAWINLYTVYQQGNETITIDNATIETGAVNYTAIKYDTDSSKITVSYGAPGTDFKALLSAGGKASTGRVVELIVQIGEGDSMAEFAFAGSVSSGGGSMAASGFSLSHYDINVKMFVRISNASTDYLAETNAVTVNLADVMAGATDSAYATAYSAYAVA